MYTNITRPKFNSVVFLSFQNRPSTNQNAEQQRSNVVVIVNWFCFRGRMTNAFLYDVMVVYTMYRHSTYACTFMKCQRYDETFDSAQMSLCWGRPISFAPRKNQSQHGARQQ